jgi:3-keto-disaccharide hydrolase
MIGLVLPLTLSGIRNSPMTRVVTCLAAWLLLVSAAFAAEEGFVALFDGKTLAGWQGGTDGYEVKEQAIVSLPRGSRNLATVKEFSDFHLKFEFKLTPGANNGIGIRVPTEAEGQRVDPAYAGMEIQVLDDSAEKYKDIKEWQHHGSVYGVVPAKTGHLKPAGEWNSEEIIAKGKHVTVILNGETIVDANVEKASTPKTIDGREHPGLKRDGGHICFCGHGAEVWFRNLRIKELK